MAGLTVDEVRARVEADWDRIVEVLRRKIALQSVSAKGITADHMKRSAEFVAEELRLVGVDAKVVQASNEDGTPGAWEVIGSRMVSPDAPTVLLYAHHDVQPVPDPAEWDTDPFVGTEIDGRLYGRGSADDGGGIAIHSGALKALGDDLKVNIKVFIEGEEEMGSPSFIPFISAHKDEFDSDVIIVADSGNWSAEIPSLTTSLRGNTCVDVTVRGLKHPVHSGQYGGPILDSNTLAAMLIASLYDENGDIAVPGIAAQEPVGGLQQDVDEAGVRADAGVVDGYVLAGSGSLASRLWTKPSLTVIGFDAHPVDGSFNVIAPETRFRLSLRTAPSQRPEEAQDALAEFLLSHAPFGAEIEVTKLENGMGWAMDPDAVATKDALEAMEETFGVKPINQGQGGSIPFIPELQRLFPSAQVLVTGPEDPKANAHSPNESISLYGLKHNVITEALLLDKLGR
ncbi:peptidase or deacetlylase family protein [Bifidobacterium reuteri DSM 23975]|uniref:Peptidase or deacetlylase family protein n=1 Tax=Bifidobacterium reuteri DSM 23975 TaxID=1437610 RepID=A0A087CRB9_9BIFI|nr:dipeptidase [Bifidobacterium reuteri]KFI85819.1 peptidase or deacetlylase family protein [Bifidobacterium reuteri DSM 23975]